MAAQLVASGIDEFISNMAILKQFTNGTASTDVATANGTIPTLAKLAQDIVSKIAAATTTVSTSTVEAKVGEVTIVIEAGKIYAPNQWVCLTAPTGQSLTGKVVSQVGTALKVAVSAVIGTGTASNWSVTLSGAPGVATSIAAETNLSTLVTATSAIVIPANVSAWFIANDSAADIYISKGVPATTVDSDTSGSFKLRPGERITSQELPGSGAVYAIVVLGTARLKIWSA